MEKELADISALSARVVSEYEEQAAAHAAELAVEAALLCAVVERVKPALRALSSRIVIEAHGDTVAPSDSNYQRAEKHYHERRGLRVVDTVDLVQRGTGTKTYRGLEVYLLDDGTFLGCQRERVETIWQGARDHEETSHWQDLTAIDVVGRFELARIVERIHQALEAHTKGSARRTTERMRESARKLSALIELLGK
jgi:hypothetical protein